MDREQIHDWVQIIGIFAVVLSLLFVGYEIKQSRDIAVAQMYQQRAELDISMRSLWIPDEELWKIRQMMGEEKDFSRLSNFERETLLLAKGNNVIYWEANHYLYEQGLLSQEHWDVSLRSMDNQAASHELFHHYWAEMRWEFRDGFRQVVDNIFAKHGITFE
ncbi:hypothetical protein GPB2148_2318 [marine gamma proteobacterium HTCC2148]|jgi:hypothetical protein|nr:hypothetical protein GPB2148_2318 [marine gamma proteobacterium HTCC2148]